MAPRKKPPTKRSFSIPTTLRSPLEDGTEASVGSDAEHEFFLRCCELYRVIELADRTLDSMIETYSKYRTRDLFRETLSVRYFDADPSALAQQDPELAWTLTGMFDRVHELRISLMHEDALPYTVKTRIEGSLAVLKKGWAEFALKLERSHGWKFKAFHPRE